MPNHLTLPDVGAYLALMQEQLEPWEVDAVLGMDAEWLAAVSAKSAEPKKAARKLSPALFDAIL